MVFGNGLLISTDSDDPSTIRKQVKPDRRATPRRCRTSTSPRGSAWTPTSQQTAFLTGGSIADVVGTFNYTVLGGGRIAPDPAWVDGQHRHRGGADPRHA